MKKEIDKSEDIKTDECPVFLEGTQEDGIGTHEENFKEHFKDFLNNIAPQEEMNSIATLYAKCMDMLNGENGFHVYGALIVIMSMNFRSIENRDDRAHYFDVMVDRIRFLIGL